MDWIDAAVLPPSRLGSYDVLIDGTPATADYTLSFFCGQGDIEARHWTVEGVTHWRARTPS